jgi:nucleoside-diphosphate-sugar epimerase
VRALLTGGSGFIGWHVAQLLRRRGDSVRCLVRARSRTARLVELGAELIEGDVCRPETLQRAVHGVDCVFHLAGLTTAVTPSELFRVNELGTRSVAWACAAEASPPRLIVVSSLAAAGPATAGRPRVESDTDVPVSCYGRSKLGGERAAALVADQVPVSVVRPPIVLGEGDHAGFLMFQMIRRRGVHLVPAMGAARVSVIHAADLARSLLLVAERGERLVDPGEPHAPRKRGVYFVAADEQPTYADLGRMVGAAMGRECVRVVSAPKFMVRVAAHLGDRVARIRRVPSIISLDKYREATAGSWICSPDRIASTLGFAPEMPLAQRLKQTADWYLREGWLG